VNRESDVVHGEALLRILLPRKFRKFRKFDLERGHIDDLHERDLVPLAALMAGSQRTPSF
jgi:hypothetical protein